MVESFGHDGGEEDYLKGLLSKLEASNPEGAEALFKRILAEAADSPLPGDKSQLARLLLRAAEIGIDTERVYGRTPEEGSMELPSLDTEPERKMAD